MSKKEDIQNLKHEVQKIYTEQQLKYTYYLIALSVGAIAFSINQTINEAFTYIKTVLGFAFLCWLVSIILGLKWLGKSLELLNDNIEALNLELLEGDRKEIIRLRENINKYVDSSTLLFLYQKNFFYAGVILFIIWYLLVMYQNTIC